MARATCYMACRETSRGACQRHERTFRARQIHMSAKHL